MDKIISKLEARSADITAELDALAESDELTEEQYARSLELLDTRAQLDERIASAKAEADAAEARAQAVADAHKGEQRAPEGGAHVTREERTYNPDAEKQGRSFLRDVAAQLRGDAEASQRLARHSQEERVERGGQIEARDVGTSAFAGLVVPEYLTDMAAPLARAARPFADNCCTGLPLPSSGNTVNISRITTGTSAAVQATENSAVSETNIDDTLLTVNVRTIAGQQDVSYQAVDRGTGVDGIVVADLIGAYNAALDDGILNDDGTSGTHLGVRSTSSIVSVTYTDASPTVAELYPKLHDLIQQVQSGVYTGISHFVMHPRRWSWFVSSVGTSFPFVRVSQEQSAGNSLTREYGSVVGDIAGVPVVVDGNMKTDLGGGTEDVIIGATKSENFLWEDSSAPLLIRAEEAAAANLSVKFVVYGYSAFSAGRRPGAHGVVSGTGLAAPTF